MSHGIRVALLAIALGLAVLLGIHLALGGFGRSGTRPEAHDLAEARLAAVRDAANALIPGATQLAARPARFLGDQRVSHTLVTYAVFLRRRIDLAGVAMDDARGGPVEALLDLAHAQEAALRKAGFDPMAAHWSTRGGEGRVPIEPGTDPQAQPPPIAPPSDGPPDPTRRPTVTVRYTHHSDSGGGGSRMEIDLDAAEIVHERIYTVAQSGATLFVRSAYDQATRIAEVELSYSDRTLLGVEYPRGSHFTTREPGHYSIEEVILGSE